MTIAQSPALTEAATEPPGPDMAQHVSQAYMRYHASLDAILLPRGIDHAVVEEVMTMFCDTIIELGALALGVEDYAKNPSAPMPRI